MAFNRLKKFLHWEGTQKPDIDMSGLLYEQLKPFRAPFLLLFAGLLLSTLGYVVVTGYSLIDAFFQASYTFTTTGFGALKENEFDGLDVFYTAVVMMAGSAVLSFCVISVIDVLNRGKLIPIIKERNMIYRIARLKNHFIICYHNEYTIRLSQQFREAHIPFVVVDNSEVLEDIAQKYRYPFFINEDPHTEIAMLKCHLSSARGVITLSSSIADNIAQIASVRLYERELGRKPYFIIANANTNEDEEKLKKLGADCVVSPARLFAQRVNAMATRPDMENLLERFAYQKDTPLDLEEILVPRYSWLVFKKLKEAHMREIAQTSIVGITQKDGKFIPMPNGDTLVTSECKLLVIGTSNGVHLIKQLVSKKDKPEELKYV
ncbi:potassium channel family protein [Helicobacter sp.]|uniref:potassium channel family protein n=1 Tax=Helicobacter sp. TaxID=218 RepID=UPI0025B7B7F6|nr:potassium channel protein [Helicobacter sp.]MCI5968020.1 NAD-binding protein [Helicobacter sp.]MDY2584671.1 NAD-binding protein [Helicobacter sp.]